MHRDLQPSYRGEVPVGAPNTLVNRFETLGMWTDLDSWGSIVKGRVELEPIVDHLVRQLAPENPVVNVETDEQNAW